MASTHRRRAHFGPFELDLDTLELRRDDELVTLTPQPAKALALLVENAGTLVTRERFYERLWPDSTVALDQGLNTCIRQLRTALGDDSDAPVFIETVPRRGYRFLLPVRPSEVPAKVGHWRTAGASLVALVAMAVVGLGLWRAGEDAAPPPVRLAVLPFQAIAQDEDTRLFAEGLSEELVTALAGMDPERLAVIASTSSARFARRSSDSSIVDVGTALRADFVVEGSVRPSKDGYRVSVRLIDVSSETSVWSDQRSEDARDPVSTQAWLATRVSRALVPRIEEARALDLSRRDPVPEARITWLMAVHLLGREDAAGAERSVPLLKDVLEADPSFARAHAGLARAYLQLGREDDAEAALSRALDLEPELPEALFVRGRLRLSKWDLGGATRDFERAARLSPSDSRIHDYYAYLLAVTSQHDRARAAMSRAADIDPVSSAIFADVGLFEYWGGRPREGTAACEQALKVALPEHRLRAHRCLVHTYEASGKLEKAREHALAIVEAAGTAPSVYASISEAGDPKLALEHYFRWGAEESNLPASQGSTAPYARARAAAAAGDLDGTLRWLDRALASRDPSLVQIQVEPRFAPVRNDARFLRIVRAVGLPESDRR